MSDRIRAKIRRLRRGKPPAVVDLFAGCGGFSLGFLRAGAHVVAGVEVDPVRASTYALNFHPAQAPVYRQGLDITRRSPHACLEILCGRPVPDVDVIIGGPPCQAYARVGRAKLREIARHPQAHLKDRRGGRYAAYIAWVRALHPVAVVMENVPDILSYGGVNVGETIADDLEALGYQVRYTLLNSVNYGVPQTRERWFLLGIHREAGRAPIFPEPITHVEMPVGYRGTRSQALRWDRDEAEDRPPHAVPLRPVSPELPNAVTCVQALGDLPYISQKEKAALKPGARDLQQPRAYRSSAVHDYQKQMRHWPGFEREDAVTAHVIRSLPRDYEIFRRMEPGDDYPAALRVAEKLFSERLAQAEQANGPIRKGSAKWVRLHRALVPPYDPGKFPNKWRKLERHFPSRTLMAHLSHDSYSHIHFDSRQARTISVREAARLQSFPDGFEFCGAMNAAFGQIGNAVPPLMAGHLARQLIRDLRDS